MDASVSAYKSIKNAVGFLRAVLNANDITIKMGSIRLPKKEVRERRLPSADVIYAIVKGTSSELPVLLAMWLSLRIGEVAGLQFCDIDPVQMRLYVRRDIVKVDSGWAEIDHCKTVKSMRYVNLPAYIYALIQQVPHQSGTDHIDSVHTEHHPASGSRNCWRHTDWKRSVFMICGISLPAQRQC